MKLARGYGLAISYVVSATSSTAETPSEKQLEPFKKSEICSRRKGEWYKQTRTLPAYCLRPMTYDRFSREEALSGRWGPPRNPP